MYSERNGIEGEGECVEKLGVERQGEKRDVVWTPWQGGLAMLGCRCFLCLAVSFVWIAMLGLGFVLD